MKKSLICIILLAVLSLGGLIFAHVTIASTADQVVITQHDLYGDPHAADGLAVNRKASLRTSQPLGWDTTYPVNGTAETRFLYDHLFIGGRSENNLYINSATPNQGYGGTWEYPITDQDIIYRELFNDVAENTPVGESRTETMRLRDYMDTIPLDVNLRFYVPDKLGTLYHININTDEFWRHYQNQDPADIRDYPRYKFALDLAEAFSFPMPEDAEVSVSVTRDSEGNLVDMKCSEEGDWLSIQSLYTDAGDWIYFAVQDYREGDRPAIDYSGTPAGFAVYRLPIRDPAQLSLDDLEPVLLLDPDRQALVSLCSTRELDRILVTTREKGCAVLRVLDSRTGALLQTLELDSIEEDGWNSVLPYNGFAVLNLPTGFRVLEELPDGTYRPRFLTTDPDPEEFPVLKRWYGYDLAFDGQRLAVFKGASNQYDGDCGFMLEVHDESGLLYIGEFSSSLDAGMGWEKYYNSIIHPDYWNQQSIAWS